MAKPDGGPAFPSAVAIGPAGDVYEGVDGGMTLRDWFAGQALAGLLANPSREEAGTRPAEAHYAAASYLIADAMLAERDK